MKPASQKAFTIVETLIVVLLSTVVFAGIYSAFIVGNKAWVYYNDSVAVKKEARRAMAAMTGELREAENIKIIESPEGAAIHFFRQDIGAVSYVWNRKGENAGRLIRYSRLGTRTLAQYISSLGFARSPGAVQINLAAGKTAANGKQTEVALREKIALRAQTAPFN